MLSLQGKVRVRKDNFFIDLPKKIMKEKNLRLNEVILVSIDKMPSRKEMPPPIKLDISTQDLMDMVDRELWGC